MSGRNNLWDAESYCKNKESMQIISRSIGDFQVYFQAPLPQRLLR